MTYIKKLKNIIRYNISSFHRIYLDKRPMLLIYQSGKVASSSVYYSAKQTGKYMVHQVHRMCRANIERTNEILRAKNVKTEFQGWHIKLFEAKLNPPKEKVKIVTLVREPVSRNFSAFYENIDRIYRKKDAHLAHKPEELVEKFLASYNHEIPLEWFDVEFLPVTGIDIYAHPFDRDKGYSIIKEGHYEILVLHHDLPDGKKQELLQQFLDIPDFQLINKNIASEKNYSESYLEFKRLIELPSSYVDDMLDSKYFQHFYSPDVARKIRDRWIS